MRRHGPVAAGARQGRAPHGRLLLFLLRRLLLHPLTSFGVRWVLLLGMLVRRRNRVKGKIQDMGVVRAGRAPHMVGHPSRARIDIGAPPMQRGPTSTCRLTANPGD